MAALINTIPINYYKQQCRRTLRTNEVCTYSEVRSVVGQPKCHQIELFSWILDDGRAPATGIRQVNLEPTDGNISPVSVRSVLFKVAGYPGKFPVGLAAAAAAPGCNRCRPRLPPPPSPAADAPGCRCHRVPPPLPPATPAAAPGRRRPQLPRPRADAPGRRRTSQPPPLPRAAIIGPTG